MPGDVTWNGGRWSAATRGGKLAALFVLSVIMIAGACFCTTLPGAARQVAGWFGVFFFGLAPPIIVVRLCQRHPVVIIGPDGVLDSRLTCGPIHWSDVTAVERRTVSGNSILCIRVRDEETYIARMSRWKALLARFNRVFGFPPLSIGFTGLTPGMDAVWEAIEERLTIAATPLA